MVAKDGPRSRLYLAAYNIYTAELESLYNSHALRLLPDGPSSPAVLFGSVQL